MTRTPLPLITASEHRDATAPAHACVVFLQGEDADTVLDVLLDRDGVVWHGPTVESTEAALPYLTAYLSGDVDLVVERGCPWEPSDRSLIVGDYVITWEPNGLYISLYLRATQCAGCFSNVLPGVGETHAAGCPTGQNGSPRY